MNAILKYDERKNWNFCTKHFEQNHSYLFFQDGFDAIYHQLSEHNFEDVQYFFGAQRKSRQEPKAYRREPCDHLGSSSFITDASGTVDQHLQYLPYGEPWIDQRTTTGIRFTFSGKEKDEETNYSYFGARYYNADISIWLSVDPLASKGPNITPYAYCHNNPVILIDPDGNWPNVAAMSAWFTAVFESASTQMAQHRFNEMKDRTNAALGHKNGVRVENQQSFMVEGSSLKSKLQLASSGKLDNEVSGTTNYKLSGAEGRAEFRGQRKNNFSLYNVTSIDFDAGREGRGTSGGGFGGHGYLIVLENSNNRVAYMKLDSKQDFLNIKNSFYQSVDNQFLNMLEDFPMVKDYYNNVHPALEAQNKYFSSTREWTQANRDQYQKLQNTYNESLNDFKKRWNGKE